MKDYQKVKLRKRIGRQLRVRAKVSGSAKRPRLSVSRSAKHVSVQLIDDNSSRTIVSASDAALDTKNIGKNKKTSVAPKDSGERKGKIAIAYEVGKVAAQKAKEKGIEFVVFDRGGFKYHGRVRAVAEGARDGGLKF